jgi:hypothetical protein
LGEPTGTANRAQCCAAVHPRAYNEGCHTVATVGHLGSSRKKAPQREVKHRSCRTLSCPPETDPAAAASQGGHRSPQSTRPLSAIRARLVVRLRPPFPPSPSLPLPSQPPPWPGASRGPRRCRDVVRRVVVGQLPGQTTYRFTRRLPRRASVETLRRAARAPKTPTPVTGSTARTPPT